MPRCKICKVKFVAQWFLQKTCKEPSCVLEHSKNEKEKKWKKEKKAGLEALKSKSDYEKELEKIFNKFIRLRDENMPCISCDTPAGKYTLTAGHFYPAGHYKNIRFNEDNVHGQCWFNCNMNRHGNINEYRPRLIKKIGQERFDKLEADRLVERKYTIPELQEMKEDYKFRIKHKIFN